MKFDFVEYAKTLANPGNPNDLIDEALTYLFRMELSPQVKQQMKTQLLLSGQQYDYYWTNAWHAYIASPTAANFNIVNLRIRELFKYLMSLSEYQLS